jgi:NAD(P)-dependent dehydrogenase (short-subunit alcohol dehydrogenase family)
MSLPRIVLVTGSSRGIGAEVARRLADPDVHVIVHCREKERRATAVAEAVQNAGGRASTVCADLTDPQAVTTMLAGIGTRFGRLDTLILNASGGLERGADPGYAMRINRDAQVRLARSALPLMPPGARIVFVTSHQAHFHGRLPVPDDYVPVARSKRAGEDDLRALEPRFAARGVGLTVVSGDMVDGTIIVRLLERRDPEAVTSRRDAGQLPTLEEFAAAVVAAAQPSAPVGRTVYVGGADHVRAGQRAAR